MYHPHHIRDCVTLDWETEKILNRPQFPPAPVGLAIRWPGGDTDYMAFGHPTENNCSLREVRNVVKDIWRSDAPLLFFNGKFDLQVFYEKLDMRVLPWDRVHDAQFLAFLCDPHSKELDLKTLAEEWLGWPPEEKDAIADYVWENRLSLVRKYGSKITKAKSGPYSAGAWISKCPANLIEPYAIGDVERTYALFEELYPLVAENSMTDAYDRERKVMPIFIENEKRGMRVDMEALNRDVPALEAAFEKTDDLICKKLNAPGMNLNSGQQFADALEDAGVVDPDDWVYTPPSKRHPEGQRSTSKDNLTPEMMMDQDIADLWNYRNRLQTAMTTFLRPWHQQALVNNGRITTNWNQVAGDEKGTRTGRPSTSKHNFLNIPKEFKEEFNLPEDNKFKLPPLPFVRKYVLPEEGHTFIHRDFDGQEMRVFAHYEDGALMEKYLENPKLDPHKFIQETIYELFGIWFERTEIKGINFQRLYGGGNAAFARVLGCSMSEAKSFKKVHSAALPGIDHVNEIIEKIIRGGDPIRTWGGRCYYKEPNKIVKGRLMDFLYKLINYLCQGSAADITKQALINWYYHPKREANFLVTVYDEINISALMRIAMEQNLILKECMEAVKLDVPMLSSGKMGTSWGTLEKCI